MAWELVQAITTGIDEPAEGAELAWAEERFHGEELTPARDDDWPAFPRAALAQAELDVATLAVVDPENGAPLAVTDYTSAPTVPPPPPGGAYLRRYDAPDFDRAYLYFHPAYEGRTVRADYRYYDAAAAPHAFVAAGDALYFTTAAGARWWRLDDAGVASLGWVKPSATAVNDVTAGDGGELWALAAPDGLLARFARRPSGYLDVEGVELPGLTYLGELAQATAAVTWLEPRGAFHFGTPRRDAVELPRPAVLTVAAEVAPAPAAVVELSYLGGVVRAGAGPVTYAFTNRLVTSRAHAQLLCEDLAQRFDAAQATATVEVADEYYAAPGTLVRAALGARDGAPAWYRVTAARRDPSRRTARLELTPVASPGAEVNAG